jgi:hypothetical protein
LVSLREGDVKRVTLTHLDREGNAVGDPAILDGVDAQMIKRLWHRIEETVADLIDHRHQLLAATLYGQRVSEIDSPAPVAVAIVNSVAPLVRDLSRHSRTPGELQLKRDLGDGRREELFISNAEMVQKYAHLVPEHRELFACYGLEAATRLIPEKRRSGERTEVLPEPRPSSPVPLEIRARHGAAPPVSGTAPRQLAPASEPPHASSARPPLTSYVAPAGGHGAISVPPAPALPNLLPAPSQPRRRGQVVTSAPPLAALPHPTLPPPPRQPSRRALTPPHLRAVNG